MASTYRYLLALVLLAPACAPNNAKEIRELKPVTIGLLGAAYRPTGDQAFGVTGAFTDEAELSQYRRDTDTDRKPKIADYSGLGLFWHYYFFDESAFFLGASVDYRNIRFSFREMTERVTGEEQDWTDVEFRSETLWLGVPLGWSWIWNSGFTLMLDLGPRFLANRRRSFVVDGEDEDVNVSRRDDYADELEGPIWSIGGQGIIGWSF